jgi:transposase
MSDLDAAHARIAALEAQLAEMSALVEWFKKQLFGSGHSEKLSVLQQQLEFKLKELDQAREEEAKTEEISYERKKAQPRQIAAERFEHVPVKETVVIEPEEVLADPELYEPIGEEKTFEIDIKPPQVFKREIIRRKYRHRIDRSRAPVVAPAPKRISEGGYASPGLITWVILSEYRDHLPLHRQESMLKRWEAPVARQTMCDWVESASSMLEVIYWMIRSHLIGCGYLQADETPIQFMDPDQRKGKTSQGYMWLIGQPGGCVFIEWQTDRSQQSADKLLKGFAGVLQSDGYAGYNNVLREAGDTISRVGCWAHCRRKFTEAMTTRNDAAAFMLRLIGNLYHLDNQWQRDGMTDPAQRAHLRQRDFVHTLQLLRKAAVVLLKRERPGSNLGKACKYLLNQWDTLIAHCRHGQTRLDNNLIENDVRPTKLGQRNWLFIGAPRAGKRSAIIYTILLSCRRCGIDPHAYIEDLLYKLPVMTNQENLTCLLPHNWKPPVADCHPYANSGRQRQQPIAV